MTENTASETGHMRPWMIGAVLWAVVFVWGGAYFLGYIERPGTETSAARDTGDSAAPEDSKSGDVSDSSDSQNEKADGERDTDDTEGDDGSDVVELVPEEDTGETPSPWDPEGIADFEFTERSGKTVTKQDLLGKPWIVSFIFTTCAGPCPLVTGQMSLLQERLKDSDIRLVTITVRPEYDTPKVLSKYADLYGADPEKWLFLTGDEDEIYTLIKESFKMPVKKMTGKDRKPGYEVLHTTNLLRVNAEGVVVGKYDAQSDAELAELRRDLKKELEGSSQE